MATCPRCGNAAEPLAGDAFSLLYCEFCGDTIDATHLAFCDDLDQTIQRRPIPYDARVA